MTNSSTPAYTIGFQRGSGSSSSGISSSAARSARYSVISSSSERSLPTWVRSTGRAILDGCVRSSSDVWARISDASLYFA